jgi:hypothetical protein
LNSDFLVKSLAVSFFGVIVLFLAKVRRHVIGTGSVFGIPQRWWEYYNTGIVKSATCIPQHGMVSNMCSCFY